MQYEISDQHMQIIVDALAKVPAPWGVVNPVIVSLLQQQQQQAQQAEPAPDA